MEIKQKELFELVLPEFFDADALKTPSKITYRIDNQGERLYARMDDGLKIVPSVTTILRQQAMDSHLLKWFCDEFTDYKSAMEFVDRKADYGTFMHMLFKEILLGNTLVFNAAMLGESFAEYLKGIGKRPDDYDLKEAGQNLKQDLWAFVQFCITYKVKPLAIEYIVFGDKYAGAIDLVCKMTIRKTRKAENYQSERMFAFLPAGDVTEETEVIGLIDFKSGRKEFYGDNQIQLHAYRELWNQEYPEHQIELIANYGCKDYRLPVGKTEPYRFKQYKDDATIAKRWQLLVDLYHTEEIKIKDRVEFTDAGQISLQSQLSELVEKIDVQEQLIQRMGEDNGRTNSEGEQNNETAGDRENQDRAEGAKRKRKGKADESGLFQG